MNANEMRQHLGRLAFWIGYNAHERLTDPVTRRQWAAYKIETEGFRKRLKQDPAFVSLLKKGIRASRISRITVPL